MGFFTLGFGEAQTGDVVSREGGDSVHDVLPTKPPHVGQHIAAAAADATHHIKHTTHGRHQAGGVCSRLNWFCRRGKQRDDDTDLETDKGCTSPDAPLSPGSAEQQRRKRLHTLVTDSSSSTACDSTVLSLSANSRNGSGSTGGSSGGATHHNQSAVSSCSSSSLSLHERFASSISMGISERAPLSLASFLSSYINGHASSVVSSHASERGSGCYRASNSYTRAIRAAVGGGGACGGGNGRLAGGMGGWSDGARQHQPQPLPFSASYHDQHQHQSSCDHHAPLPRPPGVAVGAVTATATEGHNTSSSSSSGMSAAGGEPPSASEPLRVQKSEDACLHKEAPCSSRDSTAGDCSRCPSKPSSHYTQPPPPPQQQEQTPAQSQQQEGCEGGVRREMDSQSPANGSARKVDLAADTYKALRDAELRDRPARVKPGQGLSPLMRAVLLDWVTDVHVKLKLGSPALHLAFLLLDRYTTKVSVDRQSLQLVALACLLLAAKHEDLNPPSLSECIRFLDGGSTSRRRAELGGTEKKVLLALEFRLLHPTAMDFLDRFLAVPAAGPLCMPRARYFAERALYEPSLVSRVAPSRLAGASVYLARKNESRDPWPPILESMSGYTEQDLLPTARTISKLVQEPLPTVGPRPLTALTRKYGSPRFREVSKMAHLVLPPEPRISGRASVNA